MCLWHLGMILWSLTLVNKTEMRTLTAGIQMTYMGEYNYD
jgi:hypothetical protein